MKHEIRKGKSGGKGSGAGGGAGGDRGGDSWGNGDGPARAVDASGGVEILIVLVLGVIMLCAGGCASMNSTTHVEYSPKDQSFTYDQVNTPFSAEITDTSATLRAVRHNPDGTQDVVEARIQRTRSEDPRAAVSMWDRAMSGLHDLGMVLVGWLSRGTAP